MSERRISVRELVLFPMLGSLMFASKIMMEVLPNIHLLGMLVMVYTIAFRTRALIPIYIYVFLNGLFAGFDVWWVPYLYIWTILWALTMLLPRRMPKVVKCVIYPLICCLHGLLFGVLYAPAQALMYGMDLRQTVAWVITGLPFDLIHCISNFAAGILIQPLSELLQRLMKRDISVHE